MRLFQPLHDGFNRGVPVGFVGGAQAVEFVDGLCRDSDTLEVFVEDRNVAVELLHAAVLHIR